MHVHGWTAWEILAHALHQEREACIAQRLIVENDQQRSGQIAHALHVADVQVLPHVPTRIRHTFHFTSVRNITHSPLHSRANHISQLLQIALQLKVVVVAIAPVHVLVDAM